MRIGTGFDIHQLVAQRKLILGGVTIPYHKGLLGHSDADCLIHAVCDALLGAAGLGDIGQHFPDTDMQWKDISSMILLETVHQTITQHNLRCINIDTVIIANQPKLSPYYTNMRENMSRVLHISPTQVNIKSTTTEGIIVFTKNKEEASSYHPAEAIACSAVCLLRKEGVSPCGTYGA